MRLIFLFTLLASTSVWAQTKLFDLDKLESGEFRNFLSQKDIIVVGEMHGTTEVPQLVLQLVKLTRKKEKHITVGLEIESNLQNGINDFLRTGKFGQLLKHDYFKVADGRTSLAMRALMEGLRKLENIKIVCFDADSVLGNNINRDSVMAANLSNNFTVGKMIVLTGNLHANLKAGYWRPNFRSAICRFKELHSENKLVSLNTYFGGGTIWNCMRADGCKERPAYSNPGIEKKSGMTNFMAVNETNDGSGYDGFVYFESVTASKPLVE
jgi:hypothetical protein